MLEKGRHQIAVNLSLQDGEKHSLATYLEPQNFSKNIPGDYEHRMFKF